MSKKAIGLLAALSANVIWGFMSIPLRQIKNYDANQILYYRIAVSFFICLFYILLFRRKSLLNDINAFSGLKRGDLKQTAILILLSGVFITLNWFSFIYVINNVNIKSAAFAYMVCPLITALGGYFLLKENLSVTKFVAIGIAIISIILLSTGSLKDTLCSVLIAFFYSFFLIIQRKVQGINKLNMLFVQLVIAMLIIAPIFFLFPEAFPKEPIFWLNIILISTVFTILPLLLSLYALESLPSSTVGILIYINPIVVFNVAFFYFKETVRPYQIMAYSILVLAVILFNYKILLKGFGKIKSNNNNNIPVQ
ncbi:EamA family transporter [Pedobacter sp. SD-b]|uniref:EamA family transporter n=1 Tax=Pedobacter segetis TaxID=2793069 RepID=A0ABS1BJU0_9SPHI|nr:EamA family transporter [Pedobacter segetis]MBK0383159.1 EamA family transporter [Pedobacter segetis]